MDSRLGLKAVETLEEYKSLVTPQAFNKAVQQFDKVNQELIDLYEHLLGQLSETLLETQKELIENLSPLATLLYWRGEKNTGTA